MNLPLELRTERLLLRPFTPADVEDVLEYINRPEWAEFQVNIPPVPVSRKYAEELLAIFSNPAAWVKTGIFRIFAIVFEGKVIGEIVLNLRQHDDRESERVELAYTLAYQHWGKGLTTEAARAVIDWAFQNYNFNRIYAWSDPRNIGSWRVMEKLGMKREGLLRSHMKWNGEFRDQVYYGILRSEWKDHNP